MIWLQRIFDWEVIFGSVFYQDDLTKGLTMTRIMRR